MPEVHDDFKAWANHILITLEGHGKDIKEIRKDIGALRVEIAEIKASARTRASFLGGAWGLGVSVIVVVLREFMAK
jgi:hypothetical protein